MKFKVPFYRYYNVIHGKNPKISCNKCKFKKNVETTLSQRQKSLYERTTSICLKKGWKLLTRKEDILNNVTYIKYKCPFHGTQEMRISNLISGKGCPKCQADNNSKRFRNSDNKVEKKINKCGGEWLNKGEYINQDEKNLLITCPNCKTPFMTSLNLFTQRGGQMCPNCHNSESIGEMKIRQYLEKNNINFKQEFWFSDCRDMKPLPFDFYLIDYNTIIEFDGRQHFEETNFFSYSFAITKKHDKIKSDYCLKKGIKIIRISYKNINDIEVILKKKIELFV